MQYCDTVLIDKEMILTLKCPSGKLWLIRASVNFNNMCCGLKRKPSTLLSVSSQLENVSTLQCPTSSLQFLIELGPGLGFLGCWLIDALLGLTRTQTNSVNKTIYKAKLSENKNVLVAVFGLHVSIIWDFEVLRFRLEVSYYITGDILKKNLHPCLVKKWLHTNITIIITFQLPIIRGNLFSYCWTITVALDLMNIH